MKWVAKPVLPVVMLLWLLAADPLSAAARGLPDFSALVETSSPAVVNIATTQQRAPARVHPPTIERGDERPLDELFRRFFDEDGGAAPDATPFAATSLGSGFLISDDGYILTSYHVVRGADEILVTLSDRRQFVAATVGHDEESDLALLKVDARDLPVARLGSAQGLKVGEWVVAIGSPFGFEHSVTAGIVSAKGRSLRSERFVPFIQTDVAINPGNSGGPLFNLDGEVVGINSQIFSRTGGFQGISFAIPVEVALDVVEQLRADVFVRRLIERIGLRRHRLFVATPEAAERLQSLSRLEELAAAWTRREPRGSVRDFVRHLTAVADAGELDPDDASTPPPGEVVLAEPEQVKGLEFDRVYLLGLDRGAIEGRPWEDEWVPPELVAEPLPDSSGGSRAANRRRMLVRLAMTRGRRALVLSYPEPGEATSGAPSMFYESALRVLDGSEELHAEELFGPAEGLHSTYRMLRDEVLEGSWRAGAALSEMRLDTAHDVNRAVARFLELGKIAALIQRPGGEPAGEALAAINDLLGRVVSPEQRAELGASALDDYIVGEERDRDARREQLAARGEPSLEQFLPRRGGGLALSASDIDLYRTCPLKYKFARVFAIPQEPTINQRFGILIHQVLERFHAEEAPGRAAEVLRLRIAHLDSDRPCPDPVPGRAACTYDLCPPSTVERSRRPGRLRCRAGRRTLNRRTRMRAHVQADGRTGDALPDPLLARAGGDHGAPQPGDDPPACRSHRDNDQKSPRAPAACPALGVCAAPG
jgi:S1-C subfamily serine protease